MEKNKDFETIKKLYGESMAKFCRSHFQEILQQEGELSRLLQSKYAPTRILHQSLIKYEQEDAFIAEIMDEFHKIRPIEEKDTKETVETPEVLLAKAGYDLYRCETVADVMRFKKYYQSGVETLCTFKDPKARLERCHIFWVVRKDVERINRKDFKNPERDDEYGTSVMSFQFLKNYYNLSIKNRYNHAVKYCDNTLSNDLDKIIPGLSKSFEVHYGMKRTKQKINVILLNFVSDKNGVFHSYNCECNDTYYCNDNILITENREVQYYDKARYEVFDSYILDKKEKRIFQHNGIGAYADKTMIGLQIKDVVVEKIKGTTDKNIIITTDDGGKVEIKVNVQGQIKEFYSDKIEETQEGFLMHSQEIQKISMPNLKVMGNASFINAEKVEILDLPKIEEIGYQCLSQVLSSELPFPLLRKIGNLSLERLPNAKELNLPNLESIGSNSIDFAVSLKNIYLPKLKTMGSSCLRVISSVQELDLPNLEKVGANVFCLAESLTKLSAPKLETINSGFCTTCGALKEISIPNVKYIPHHCFITPGTLEKLELPNVKSVWDFCFVNAYNLEYLNAPQLEEVGFECFKHSPKLQTANLDNLARIDKSSFVTSKINVKKIIRQNKKREKGAKKSIFSIFKRNETKQNDLQSTAKFQEEIKNAVHGKPVVHAQRAVKNRSSRSLDKDREMGK